jgi:hypothetical protein
MDEGIELQPVVLVQALSRRLMGALRGSRGVTAGAAAADNGAGAAQPSTRGGGMQLPGAVDPGPPSPAGAGPAAAGGTGSAAATRAPSVAAFTSRVFTVYAYAGGIHGGGDDEDGGVGAAPLEGGSERGLPGRQP